jgi:transposase-like protein
MYVRFPLSLRNVEDLLFERGIDICHETVRHGWNGGRAARVASARQLGVTLNVRIVPSRDEFASD